MIYSSFNHYSLEKLRGISPGARIGLLMGEDTVRLPGYPRMLGAEALHPPDRIVTEEYVARCHAEGLAVHAWTVDSPARMRQLIAMGVDAFITDCPDSGRRAVDEAGAEP